MKWIVLILLSTQIIISNQANGPCLNCNSNVSQKSSNSKIRRKTEDGRECADAFYQNNKLFTDCTKNDLPNGKQTNKEWCYVIESQAKYAALNWDYCSVVMNYNKVIASNYNLITQLTKLVKELNINLLSSLAPSQESLEKIKSIRQTQISIYGKINNIKDETRLIDDKILKITNISNVIHKTEETLKERKIKLIEKQKKQVSNAQFNCKGKQYYDDTIEGDGLKARYFNNEYFLGYFKEKVDAVIDFDWTNVSSDIINKDNFSVIWEGFVSPPTTGKYTFSIESPNSVIVILKDRVIITHNLKTIRGKAKVTKVKSKEVLLLGETKVKIKIAYYYSIHNDFSLFDNNNSATTNKFIKLFWQSEEFYETKINKKYLFSQDPLPILKVTNYNIYNNEGLFFTKIYNNQFFFHNNKKFIIQDLPFEFTGAPCLKLITKYKQNEIKFNINTKSIVYIGTLDSYPNPLPNDYENTGIKFQILQIDDFSKDKIIKAKKSSSVSLFKKEYPQGLVDIPLTKIGLNKTGVNLVIFFGFNSSISTPLSCSGDEVKPSLSSSSDFNRCISSSHKTGFRCEDGLSNRNIDEEGSFWASDNEGVGAWIEIFFNGQYELTKLSFKNRINPAERNSILKLDFSTGDSFDINVDNNDNLNYFSFEPIVASSVKITIKGVYSTLNNGGSFVIYGYKCSENTNINMFKEIKEVNELSPVFKKEETDHIILSCYDSIAYSNKFDNSEITVDKKILIKCPESCENVSVPLYGYLFYSKDSSICKAAYHSKFLTNRGGFFYLVIKNKHDYYKSILSNGIKSEGKSYSSLSITFEEYIKEDIINPKAGKKIDVKLDTSSPWQPGLIVSLTTDNGSSFLNVVLDGLNSKVFNIPYPNKDRISPCGTYIKDRKCRDDQLSADNKSIFVRFVPKDYQTVDTSFVSDYGEEYGTKEKSFGWNKDISKRIKQKRNIVLSSQELETFVELTPSENSLLCKSPSDEVLCEPINWFIKVGKGIFVVKLFIGDPVSDFKSNLVVNNKVFTNGEYIQKNKLFTVEKFVESINDFITISSKCTKNCEYNFDRLNAVKITAYEYYNKEQKDLQEYSTQCGKAFKGGKCLYGPDVLHCIFNDPTVISASFCHGDKILKGISSDYFCKDQTGHYKCVRKSYINEDECKLYCPGKCTNEKCE